jgi:hypothetical protein
MLAGARLNVCNVRMKVISDTRDGAALDALGGHAECTVMHRRKNFIYLLIRSRI